MLKILKNITVVDIYISDMGIVVPANGSYSITITEAPMWATSIDVISPVNNGDIVVNNGLIDLSAIDGLRFLQYPDRATIQKNGTDVTEVSTIVNFEGPEFTVTNNGNGKTTVRVDALGAFSDTMYWANCVCHCDGLMFSDFEPLVDYTYNAIKVEDC